MGAVTACGDGKAPTAGVVDIDTEARDISFLVSYARTLPYADATGTARHYHYLALSAHHPPFSPCHHTERPRHFCTVAATCQKTKLFVITYQHKNKK